MSEGYDKLKSIGAQKIHEATHISRAHVQAFLHESFDDITKIQFLGFVSILEREYGVNLDELKNKGLAYFDENASKIKEEQTSTVFVPAKKKSFTAFYIALVVLIFGTFSYFNIISTGDDVSKVIKVDNSAIESAKSNIAVSIVDVNSSDTNASVVVEETVDTKEEIKVPIEKNEIISFKIIPKREVWLGYIDLATYEKGQKIFADEFTLDPSRDWLLSFGHGNLSIEINGIIKKFSNPKNVRFSYINSELKEVDFTEFKNLNRGSKW